MSEPTVAAVIQARMNSTRLPGKVLQPLAGRPLLWHVVSRLQRCRSIAQIAIATSTSPEDDSLAAFADQLGIEVVRGPEDNVLERYRMAAAQLKPDAIVRVTGDSPLIDPRLIDRLVDHLMEAKLDYSIWPETPRSVHEGIDPFRVEALNRLIELAGDDPIAREHVSAYFKQHPEKFSIGYLPIDPREYFQGARFSVDTPADLEFLEEVYRRLGVPAGAAEVRDVVRLLKRRPELLTINHHVYQKRAADVTQQVVFRCDGDSEIGMGHVVRSIALANELRDLNGWGVIFAMQGGAAGIAAVHRAHFPVIQMEAGEEPDQWLQLIARRRKPSAIVVDTRYPLSRTVLGRLRDDGIAIVCIDDLREHRMEAELTVHPPVPQVAAADWAGFRGDQRVGWDWVVLRREFANCPPRRSCDVPQVLVTMGGSDPARMTLAAVAALDRIDSSFKVQVVLGAGFQHEVELRELLSRTRRTFDVLRDVTNMAELMSAADLAVASFGVTAYELAACGTPGVFFSLTADHEESATVFVEHGMAMSLGQLDERSEHRLATCVQSLLANPETLQRMSHAARNQVDGRGAARIASWITSRCARSSATKAVA